MPSELIVIALNLETSETDRQSVRRRLEHLDVEYQLSFKSGFVIRIDREHIPLIRTWPDVRVAGGVYMKRKEVARIHKHAISPQKKPIKVSY